MAARVRQLTADEAAPEVQEIFERQIRYYGAPLNTTGVYAHRPTILEGATALSAGINASGLIEGSLKSLVCLRAATINGCPF
jgi:alkylhydroperoxidase family enzyme